LKPHHPHHPPTQRLVLKIEGADRSYEFSLDEFTPRREYNEIVIPKTKYRDLRRILLRVLPSGTLAPPL
jgi:hypothetical protein